MATIETRIGKDGGKQYRVKLRLKGYPAASATFTRLTDAKTWAAQTEAAIRAGRYFEVAAAKRITLAEVIDRYLAEYLPTSGIRTKQSTAQYLRFWRDELGALSLADVTADRIVKARAELLRRTLHARPEHGAEELIEKTYSPSTANRYFVALRACLNVARREFSIAIDNPCNGIKKLAEPRGRIRSLDDAEREALLRECRAHDEALYTLVVLALSTGARQGELLGLRWADVDMKRGLLTFHQTKNGERRTVPLVESARALLSTHAKVRRLDSDLVFPGNTGEPRVVGKMFSRACQRAGVKDFRFHDLRHTAASYIAMNGGTLAEIAEVLGHKTLAMVKRYTHLTEGHTRSVLERMNQRVFGE